MRLAILFATLVLVAAALTAQEFSAKELRQRYYDASQNSKAAERFYDSLSEVNGESKPLLQGYKAMAEFMVCYHSKNPYTKLRLFLVGKSTLDRAITQAPDNVELRYLRFAVQTNAPEFLGYRGAILEDKEVILRCLETGAGADEDLYCRMMAYLLSSPICSNQEKKKLRIIDNQNREEGEKCSQ